jgi:hypothetical protein
MKTLLFALVFAGLTAAQIDYQSEFAAGNFNSATQIINKKLSENITPQERYELMFKLDLMERIKLDFRKKGEDILPYIQKYYPEADENMLRAWEEKGTLEFMMIEGEKRYFNNAAYNLFRVDSDAKRVKEEKEGKRVGDLESFLGNYIPDVVDELKPAGAKEKLKLKYKLTVNADAVPEGEVIRAWLPYPREGNIRQQEVKLLGVSEENYIIAGEDKLHRSIYMEKKAKRGEKTEFNVEFEYIARGVKYDLSKERIKEYNKDSELFRKYTAENPPHILFSDRLKNLSAEIVGNETNPYEKGKKIFEWISRNIPWASAREYSTLENISEYCITKGYGDCGIKALTFITLSRYNGIPAKWQSGWMLHPGSINLHDWAEVYFEGVGWVPVDADFGLQDSEREEVKYFYYGGVDGYHFIVNDDYAQPLFPAKIYPRSETNDFQRGEVEWRGGNLYFDKWSYKMEVEYSGVKREEGEL